MVLFIDRRTLEGWALSSNLAIENASALGRLSYKKLKLQLGTQKLEVKSDAKLLIKVLIKRETSLGFLCELFDDILYITKLFIKCKFSFIYQEGNGCAN